jgi:hypothetical protein
VIELKNVKANPSGNKLEVSDKITHKKIDEPIIESEVV